MCSGLFFSIDCVQLGFLPRAVAKWVSPLWDIGFFRFCGYICPQEALAAAFGEENVKVQLILYVSQAWYFATDSSSFSDALVLTCN